MNLPQLSWPGDLYAAAAIRPLAEAIYRAHCTADQVTPTAFDALETHQKRTYEDAAVLALRGLRPRTVDYFGQAVRDARQFGEKVIGRIDERTLWGETRER